jgi:hypothetical protein
VTEALLLPLLNDQPFIWTVQSDMIDEFEVEFEFSPTTVFHESWPV